VSVGRWRSVVVVVLAGSAVAQSTVHCHSLPTRRPSICCSHRSGSRRLLSTVLLTPSDALCVLQHCLLPLIQAIIVIVHVCSMPLTKAIFEMVGRFLAQRPYDCPDTDLFFALDSVISVSVRPTTCAPRQQPDRLKSHLDYDQESGDWGCLRRDAPTKTTEHRSVSHRLQAAAVVKGSMSPLVRRTTAPSARSPPSSLARTKAALRLKRPP